MGFEKPPKPLLAKPVEGTLKTEITLYGHNLRVAEKFRQLCRELKPFLLKTFSLSEETWARFYRIGLLAAFLHDFGKASVYSQRMFDEYPHFKEKHPLRHEMVSVLAVCLDTPLRSWLLQAFSPLDIDLAAIIIAAHHFKVGVGDKASQPWESFRVEAGLTVFWDRDFEPLYQAMRAAFPLKGSPEIRAPWELGYPTTQNRQMFRLFRDRISHLFNVHFKEYLPTHIFKSLLVVADIAGSNDSSKDDSGGNFEFGVSKVMTLDMLSGFMREDAKDFQNLTADAKRLVTLLMAACGEGKTTASHMWWGKRGVGRKGVFAYPTTIAGTEGFRKYMLDQPGAGLHHYRAIADSEFFGVFGQGADPIAADWAPDIVKAWTQPLLIGTADTVLGFFGHRRKPMALLPVWANAAFVFDEIHSYDTTLFKHLLEFLRHVKAPVLLMTATLAPNRICALEEAVGYPLVPILGEPKRGAAPRYRFRFATEAEALSRTREVLGSGMSVLWRLNQVKQAVKFYRLLAKGLSASIPKYCLHSQFKYRDRLEKQVQITEQFKQGGPCLAVATQLCEMSLDISGDFGVTQLAPITSIVQFVGRTARKDGKDGLPERVADILILQPPNALPYQKSDLEIARKALSEIEGEEVSQSDLSYLVQQHYPEEDFSTPVAVGGSPIYNCTQRDIRNIDFSKVPVLREEDFDARALQDLDRAQFILQSFPLPFREKLMEGWDQQKGCYIAPRGVTQYSSETGGFFRWLD